MVEENRHPEQGGEPAPAPPGPVPSPPPPENPAVRYEHSDASFGWVVVLIIGAMVFAAVVNYLMLWFFNDYKDYQARIKASRYPMSSAPSTRLPSGPRLEQVNRMAEIESSNVYLREEAKEAVLHGYGRAAGEGYVHIPIERAMELLENKLPARAAGPGEDGERRQNGLVDGGEPNSGRMFRGKAP